MNRIGQPGFRGACVAIGVFLCSAGMSASVPAQGLRQHAADFWDELGGRFLDDKTAECPNWDDNHQHTFDRMPNTYENDYLEELEEIEPDDHPLN